MQRVRLIRTLAPVLNGVNLSHVKVGDEVIMSEAIAAMLIREGQAELVRIEHGDSDDTLTVASRLHDK